jgi:hypothetical protein
VTADPSQQTQLLFISFTKHIRLPECAKAQRGVVANSATIAEYTISFQAQRAW